MNKIIEFFKTKTGKTVEAALWQMVVLALGILVAVTQEYDIRVLVPYIAVMNALTKWVNTKFIK